MEIRALSIEIMSALFISALGTVTVSAQAPQGPMPAQDTPPLTDRQSCLTHLNPSPKTETQRQQGENLSEQPPNSAGVVCPPPVINREIAITPPGESKITVFPAPGN
jgi:hypothetical protein